MRPIFLISAVAVWGLCFSASPARAVIRGEESVTVDFTKEEEAERKADWPEDLHVTSKGLAWTSERVWLPWATHWFRTEPLALGLAWRPTTAAQIQAVLKMAPDGEVADEKPIAKNREDGLYVRYSADAKTWSSWQAMSRDAQVGEKHSGMGFACELRVPQEARQRYEAVLLQYTRSRMQGSSNEEAAVRWMVEKEPKIFEETIPFIGYVQFLFEGDMANNRRVTEFWAKGAYALSGLHADGDSSETLPDGPWRYRATADPVEAVAETLRPSRGMWANGMSPLIELPESTALDRVLDKVFKGTSFDGGRVSYYKILETRTVQIEEPYTAVLVKTNLGRKVVLLKYTKAGGGFRDLWWSRVFTGE